MMLHKMTVAKMIERLSKYDRDTLVVMSTHDHGYRMAYVTDGLAERDGMLLSEAQMGDENAFTVVVIE